MRVSKEVQFDAGHRVPHHGGQCRNPHGHRYRVRATWIGVTQAYDAGVEAGMVVDFGTLKGLLTVEAHDLYDHAFIVWEHDEVMRRALAAGDPEWKVVVTKFIPTAENFAEHIYQQLLKAGVAAAIPARVESVEVWETPTSKAVYP